MQGVVGNLVPEPLLQVPGELLYFLVVEVVGLLGVFSGYVEHVVEGRPDVVSPQVEQPADAIAGGAADHAIEEIVFAPDGQLEAATRE